MEVRTLVGRDAGTEFEMRDGDALRCISSGTHEPTTIAGRALPAGWRSLPKDELSRLVSGIFGKKIDAAEAVARLDARIRDDAAGRVSSEPGDEAIDPAEQVLG